MGANKRPENINITPGSPGLIVPSWLRPLTILRVSSWILCSSGVIWQIVSVSKIYFEYTTRVDINITVPSRLSMPAISVCLHILYDKKVLSKFYSPPESIPSSLASIPFHILYQLPTSKVKINCTVPNNTYELPKLDPEKGFECENYSPVLVTIHFTEGINLRKCFTYFFRNATTEPFVVHYANAKDFFTVDLISDQNNSVSIFVHNPIEVLLVSDADTFTFHTNSTAALVLSSSKLITKLLPPPYRTGCETYDNELYGRTGCIFKCLKDNARERCGVWPASVPADTWGNFYFISPDGQCDYGREKKDECAQKDICPNQCLNLWYTTTLVSVQKQTDLSNLTRIVVRRPSEVEFTYIYVPKMDKIEYFCFVASCFGIWLGISFIDFLEYIIMLLKGKLDPPKPQIKVLTPTYIYFLRDRPNSLRSIMSIM
uniref:Uncharacterized protein n=1 Tax=Tetranychus urticae TaxID=32264 RepID=T1L3X6_TETUR